MIRPYARPLIDRAGLIVLRGNLFDGAVMKLSVISDEFRARYLSDPAQPGIFEGQVVVFDGPEDYHHRIDDPALGIDESTILVIRGAGPVGYPGGAEVVNMRPPAALIRAGRARAALHRRRAAIRHQRIAVDPQCLARGSGRRRSCAAAHRRPGAHRPQARATANMLVDDAELARRSADLAQVEAAITPASQTPWQEIQRGITGQFDTGAVLEPAVKYQRIAERGLPRDSH